MLLLRRSQDVAQALRDLQRAKPDRLTVDGQSQSCLFLLWPRDGLTSLFERQKKRVHHPQGTRHLLPRDENMRQGSVFGNDQLLFVLFPTCQQLFRSHDERVRKFRGNRYFGWRFRGQRCQFRS
jgi:hypothetical protein